MPQKILIMGANQHLGHPKWCRIFSINSIISQLEAKVDLSYTMLDMFILCVRYVVSSFNETEITVFAKVGFENSSEYDKNVQNASYWHVPLIQLCVDKVP